jgi:hypothetical protein
MLRLVSVKRKYPTELDKLKDNPQTEVILYVTFAGQIDPSVECEVTITMRERETDAQLLADALAVVRRAIASLHVDLQQSKPESV